MPHERVVASGHDRHRSLGWLATAWMEHWCVHGPGDIQGRPLAPEAHDGIPLSDELVALNVDAYALGERGRRLYDSAFYSRPKGADKSGHGGRIGLLESLGPCRFAGWAEGGEVYEEWGFRYEYEPGEPMGRRVTYPFIRILATEETQTGNVFDVVYWNLTEGPLAEIPGIDAGLTRVYLPDGGEIRPSTASSSAKDGGKESWANFDETHLYNTPELKRMYATVRRNLGKRKDAEPWSFESSTMYRPGEQSVAEGSHELAKKIVEGKVRRERLLFDHRQAPADVDLTDEDQVRAALVEAYGDAASYMDLDRLLDEIWDPRNDPADSRRYFFNEAHSAADSWLASYEWESCGPLGGGRALEEDSTYQVPKPLRRGDVITLGFDGSRRRSRGVTDATALIGCRVSDGHVFEIEVWEQPDNFTGDAWEVPVAEVNAEVRNAFSQYRVVAFYADPAKWETHVAAWEAKWGSDLKVKSSRSHPIEWWMTGGRARATVAALEAFHNAVVFDEMSHDGAAALTRHVLNARRRTSKSGVQIGKEHPDSPRKIDAAVAAVLAWTARMDVVAAGITTEPAGQPRRIR